MDLLLSRYGNIDFVMELQYKDGVSLIEKSFEKVIEKQCWDMWISLYPNFNKSNFLPFSEFMKKQRTPQSKPKSITKEEILKQAEEIKRLHQNKGGDGE